jgi:hypothetical protein
MWDGSSATSIMPRAEHEAPIGSTPSELQDSISAN